MQTLGRPWSTKVHDGRPWLTVVDLGRPRSNCPTWSTVVDPGRPWSTLPRSTLVDHGRTMVDQDRLRSTIVDRGRPWPTTVDHGRPWSTMVDHGRPWSTMVDHPVCDKAAPFFAVTQAMRAESWEFPSCPFECLNSLQPQPR